MGTLIYIFFLAIYLIITTPIFFLVWLVTYPFDKKKVGMKYASMFYSRGILGVCPFWQIKVIGKKNLHKKRPYVMCINHQSMLDIPLITVMNINFRWVAKREVYNIPMIGQVLRMRDDIAIDRGGAASTKMMLRRAKAEIARGVSIAVFPEGTRSKDGKIHEFKEGAFLIAKMSKAPILPIVTYGTSEVSRLSKYKYGMKIPFTFIISILPEIPAEEVAATPVKELAKKVHDIMLAEHMRIAPQNYEEKETEEKE